MELSALPILAQYFYNSQLNLFTLSRTSRCDEKMFFFIAHTDISTSSWHNRVLWAEKIANSCIQLTLVKSFT